MISEEAAARFWAKVDRSGGPDACWPWLASLLIRGDYGQAHVQIDGATKTVRAHRIAWIIVNGEPPPDKPFVLHSCDARYPVGSIEYRKCCNPAHLWPGTQADNMADAAAKNRTVSGDRHRSRTHPELLPHGDAHWTRAHPERLSSKFDTAQSDQIRQRLASGETQRDVARTLGISKGLVFNISRRTNGVRISKEEIR